MTNSSPRNAEAPRNAVALVRIAHDLAAKEQEESIQQQEAAFRRFCDRHLFQAAATFSDSPVVNGSSGEVAVSAYARMRRYISQNGNVVAAAMLSPEALADDNDERAMLLLEIENMGAKVYLFSGQSIESSAVLSGTWPAPAKVQTNTGEKIKAAMRNRAIRGEGLGKPPYGYRIGPRRKLEVVPEEAENVRLIYSLYTQKNQGIRLIVRHLNEHNILTRKGRNWSMVTIRDILRNRAYLGTYTRFGMRVPGSHPPIVTPEAFRWTQTKLEERQPTRRAAQAEPFLLSGLIYCGSCGNRMMGVTRRQSWTRQRDGSRAEKEYRYYQCQSRTNQGVCTYNTQNAAELEAKVLANLQEQRQRLSGSRSRRTPQSFLAAIQHERKRLEAAHAKTELKLRRSIKQVLAGKLSLLRFRPLSGDLLRERRQMLDRLDALASNELPEGAGLTPAQGAVGAIDELTANWTTMEFQRKKDLFTVLVDRIVVQEAQLDINLRPELL